jgi:prepilin signal peptidase PulO-like enzyme (type II secretory pathway)
MGLIILFFYIIIFVFGLATGSFLNSVIYRLDKNESFLKGRSYCPNCKHQLSWKDLIPIFSFLELQGKCRYCKKPISLHYPLVELATGILFVGVFHITFPNFLFSIFYFLLSSFLIIIFVYDLKHYIIPDAVILLAIVIALLYQIFNFPARIATAGGQFSIFNPILSALGASLFFLAIFLISKGKWLGFGDVKLAFFMGLFLGFPNILVALFLAFFIGAIIGIGLIIFGRKTLKSEVPFGPFLVIGTFIAFFFGNQIINWYLDIFK